MAGQLGGAYERPGRARGPLWRELEALVPQYADRVAASATGADVRLLGTLAPTDVRCLLAAADVFVSPSLAPEPCGLPVLEALAMDLPVVATHGGAAPELIGDAGVLVPPGISAALADALESLLSASGTRAALASRARSQASRHSWDATAGAAGVPCPNDSSSNARHRPGIPDSRARGAGRGLDRLLLRGHAGDRDGDQPAARSVLSPQDFGLVAMANLLLAFVGPFHDSGLLPAFVALEGRGVGSRRPPSPGAHPSPGLGWLP